MKNPLVSIIMNCHNGEKFLHESLKSVLSQNYNNWELIFFDNSSTDKSKKIFNSFKDSRLKYFYNQIKINLYDARNKAIIKTKGEFVAFLDTDDWWERDNLSSRKKFFYDTKFSFSYSNCYYYFQKNKKKKIFSNNNLPSGYIFNNLSENYQVNLSSIIIRRSFLQDQPYIFNKNYNIIGDFDLILRLSEKNLVHCVNTPLVSIRYHNENFSHLNRDLFFKEYKDWYSRVIKFENYNNNKKIFFKRLKYLEIIKDLVKFKSIRIFMKIIYYPICFNKIKLFIIFFTPRYLLRIFYK
jgi:glycosyltransferase involved in cell wall biosynthesis